MSLSARLAVLIVLALACGPVAEAVAAPAPKRPNLRELRLKAPTRQFARGARFLARDFLLNDGRAVAGRSTTGFYLSRTGRFDTDVVRLGGRAVKPLRPRRRTSGRKRLRVPVDAPPGTYRLIACADYLQRVRERSERDNCVRAAGSISVVLPPPPAPGPGPTPGPAPEPGPAPSPTPEPPAATPVTLTAPADGSVTNAQDVGFAGNALSGHMVTVRVLQGGVEVRSLEALPDADGAWSASAAGVGEGDYTASASQTDSFGRTQTSPAVSFRVDRTAPTPTLTAPSGTIRGSEPEAAGTRGTAAGDAPEVVVKLYTGTLATGAPILTTTIASDGAAFAGELAADLGEGTYTVVAEQADSAGNLGSSPSRTFQVDDTGPLVTLASPPADARTKDQTPRLDGTTTDAAHTVTVHVYGGSDTTGTEVQSRTTTPTGSSWAVDAANLTPGTYTAQASQPDGLGNTGTSAPHTFTVDIVAPAPSILHPSGFTGDSTPTFDGSAGTAAGDLAAITVDVYSGSNTSVSPVRSLTTTASGGSWSVAPSSALAQGSYTAVVRQSDSAGNAGTSSRAFTIDTTAPAVTVAPPSGQPSTPTFSGTAEAGPVTVRVYAGATATGTPVSTLSANGPNWTVNQPSTLSDGTYTVVAQQTDAAGNTGTSAPRTFTIDTLGPRVTLSQPADGAITNDTTPAFSGTAEDTTQVTVRVYLGTSASGSPAQTLSATPAAGGSWSVSPTTALPQGTYTAQAQQRDLANNLGESTPHTFEIDTTKPALTLTVGASRTSVHVVADDANFATLACTVDGSAAAVAPTSGSSHDAEGDVSVSGDGTHTVACTATDAASNSTSDSKTFSIDNTPPLVGVSTPAGGATIDDPTPTFSGPAGTASGDAGTVTVKVWAGATATGTPARTLSAPVSGSTWSATPGSNLAEGTWTVRAEQQDAAQNTGVSPTHTFTIGPATMLTAGDIGGCEDGNDAAGTAALLRKRPQGIVQTLGDNVYGNDLYADGSLADFENCYGPNWGTEKARTKPAIGNHEYNDPGAAGYFAYFGAVAGNPSEGWYSYDLGAWHVVVLNSNCSRVGGCSAGSDQETWLRADLAAHPAECTAAIWHHPRFTSDAFTGEATNTGAFWTDLYNADADLILVGHAHQYERFAPQNPSRALDNARGMVQIVAGMGGESHSPFASTPKANSMARNNTDFGILELTLHQDSWSSQFVGVSGSTFGDFAGGTCH